MKYVARLIPAFRQISATGPARLACVQARLSVDRIRSPLQRQFALEYAVLFSGLLPWLGAHTLPLGGTSNHSNGLMYQLH